HRRRHLHAVGAHRRAPDTRGRQHERGRDHERDERGSRLADSRGVVWGDERGRRDEGRIEGRRHEEALRDAHRRQADDLRRYRDDRDRDRREHLREGHDAGEWHDEEARHRLRLEERARRAEALERWRAEERPRGRDETRRTFAGNEQDERGARAREDGAREYRPRYALTPRERGQFVGGPGRDDFERMSRRGVERLLDDDRPGRRRDDRDD
ncbi:MAG TPA: hypothetical protein VER08_12175, partial [Pyrinomonadaceae bacterium]|nr:hypothetical protein [Pyrinomonadaceae bacterium]